MELIHSTIQPAQKATPETLYCVFCGSNRFREVLLSPIIKDGQISGGTKQLKCDNCGKSVSGG